jgi:hypothetical protein
MHHGPDRTHAYLALEATQPREHPATPHRHRAVTLKHRWTVALTLVIAAACGGSRRPDAHARASDVVARCCEHLTGGARDRCLAEMPRVDDPGAAKTSTNQQTYACVVDHFVCNPETGHATQPSAQAQYDCIEDLQK